MKYDSSWRSPGMVGIGPRGTGAMRQRLEPFIARP